MAEKEDYIVISKKDFDYKKGHYVTHSAKQMSRPEAIERMAKALYLYNREDAWYKEHAYMFSKYMNKMAEAALNALLEVK